MRVVGIDSSITSPALALLDRGDLVGLFNHRTAGKRSDGYPEWCQRINDVSAKVIERLDTWYLVDTIDLIVLEAPSHGSKFGNPHERACLWWDIYRWAFAKNIPIVTVAPTTRAKYITGSGRADKKMVMEATREHFPSMLANDDEADAYGLADMGARFFNESQVTTLPARNLEAMEVAKWPTLT